MNCAINSLNAQLFVGASYLYCKIFFRLSGIVVGKKGDCRCFGQGIMYCNNLSCDTGGKLCVRMIGGVIECYRVFCLSS